MPGATLLAQRAAPPQRGSPPGQDTPYILVTAFRAPTKALAVEGADELRDRLKQEHSAKELFVLTKTGVEGTLTASGYPIDSALNVSDLMELAKTMRGEYVTDATLKKTGAGKEVRVEARLLMRSGQQTIAQPLPPIDGKDVGEAAKLLEKSISEALKQIPMYKECVAAARAQKWDDAAAKARAAIAVYPKAAWSRVCLLTSYASNKSTPPDSIIAVGNEVLSADSTSMLALANLADAYGAKNDNEKMVDVLLRMAALDPTNRGLVTRVIGILANLDVNKAMPIVARLVQEYPGDAEMLRQKWLLELKAGQFKNALATGEELVKHDTAAANLDYFNRMIGAAQGDSNQTKVMEIAAKAGQKFPKDASFPMLLAQGQRRAGQLQQAYASSRKAMELDPKDARAWLLGILIAKDMNQNDTLLALTKGAVAAGVDKSQLETILLQLVAPVVKKADESKERADWEAALAFVSTVDQAMPAPAWKFYTGLAQFQIGLDALQNANKLGQDTGKATAKDSKAKACTEAKLVEEMWANSTISMTSGGGGAYNKEGAGSVMGAIQQYNEYIPRMKKQFCGA
jgi:tetratricopeptide (TPR) repeat protein